MDELLEAIYRTLSADSALQAMGVSFATTSHPNVEDHSFPLITYEVKGNISYGPIDFPQVEFRVFSRKGAEEKWGIYRRIRALLHRRSLTGTTSFFPILVEDGVAGHLDDGASGLYLLVVGYTAEALVS